MGFAPPKASANFTPTPAGTHVARCCQVIDLGTHPEEFQGESKGDKQKIRLGFELPLKKHVFHTEKGEEPFMIGVEYTYSLHEKAKLRKHLEAWRGKPYTPESLLKFDPTKLIGQPCLITVIHEKKADGNTVAKVTAITQLVEGMQVPPAILPTLIYSVDEGRNETFKKLPQWIQEKCSQCIEWRPKSPTEEAAEDRGAETPTGSGTGEAESQDPF